MCGGGSGGILSPITNALFGTPQRPKIVQQLKKQRRGKQGEKSPTSALADTFGRDRRGAASSATTNAFRGTLLAGAPGSVTTGNVGQSKLLGS